MQIKNKGVPKGILKALLKELLKGLLKRLLKNVLQVLLKGVLKGILKGVVKGVLNFQGLLRGERGCICSIRSSSHSTFPNMVFFVPEIVVSTIVSYLPASTGVARMVCRAWREQFESERGTVQVLRTCLGNMARVHSSILIPSDAMAAGLAPVQFYLTGAKEGDATMETRTTTTTRLREILGLPDDGQVPLPFGEFEPSMLPKLRKLGRVCQNNIYTIDDLDIYLGSHAHWIHFLFAEMEHWTDEAERREVEHFHDEMNACRWIMRYLLVNHCFNILSINGEWWNGDRLNIECLFYSSRPACRRPGGRHAVVMANLSGPRDNGELITTCSLCGQCF